MAATGRAFSHTRRRAALTGMALSSCIESPKEYTLGLPVTIFAMTAIPFVLGYMTGKSNS